MNWVAFGLTFAIGLLFGAFVRVTDQDEIDKKSAFMFWFAIVLFAVCFGAIA